MKKIYLFGRPQAFLQDTTKKQVNPSRMYRHFAAGTLYALDYNGRSGVLKVTKNIVKNPDILKSIEDTLKHTTITDLKLAVQPHGELIELSNIIRIEYF